MQTILAQSANMAHLLRTIPLLAQSDVSVLIQGETGTGKELIAQDLHAQSSRRHQPLITINCAALPADEVEVELFGRCDAQGNIIQRGRFLAAAGGTIVLDEVDALPLPVQSMLLRFLESGECQLPGSHQTHIADVRILAITSIDLQQAVAENKFRADLLYRLQVVPLSLPPLRERDEDVALLLRHFGREYANSNAVVRYSKSALHTLTRYPWPGNVRELMNFCRQMALLHAGQCLQPEDLPADIQPELAAAAHTFELPASGIQLAQVELDLIKQALSRSGGNRARASRLLGISRDTLLYRIQKYAL